LSEVQFYNNFVKGFEEYETVRINHPTLNLLSRISSVVLITILVFVLGMPSMYVAWFKMEQDKIAATLCAQREIPNNTCQGTCHMNEVLKKVEGRSDDGAVPDPGTIEIKEIQMLIEHNRSKMHKFTRTIVRHISSEKVLKGIRRNVFRPPMVQLAG